MNILKSNLLFTREFVNLVSLMTGKFIYIRNNTETDEGYCRIILKIKTTLK